MSRKNFHSNLPRFIRENDRQIERIANANPACGCYAAKERGKKMAKTVMASASPLAKTKEFQEILVREVADGDSSQYYAETAFNELLWELGAGLSEALKDSLRQKLKLDLQAACAAMTH